MKKSFLVLIATLMATSCSKEKDPCEGLVLDVIQQLLVVEIVNLNGDNLIENGTYEANTIFTDRNSTKTIPVVYDESQLPNLPEELKNVIVINIFNSKSELNTVSIHLSEEEVDVLSMNLEVKSEGCSGFFYEIIGINYNQEPIEFEDIRNNYYKIIVVK